METILQSLKRIENIIYTEAYDDLTEYLQGVRDMINLINGEEGSEDVANTIIRNFRENQEELNKWQTYSQTT